MSTTLTPEAVRTIAAAAADHDGDRALSERLRLIPLDSFEAAMRARGTAAPGTGGTASRDESEPVERGGLDGYEAAYAAAKEYRA